MKPAVEVKALRYIYPDGTEALRGIDIKVSIGEKLVVMGENGSGKSTLFLHLNGVLKPASGEVIVGNRPINYCRKGLLDVRRRVGIVFQNPDNQLFSASVLQEISFGVLNLGFSEEEAMEKVIAVMNRLNIFEFKDKPTHFLSGGQKKRVAIADVVAMEPDVIIFDEPTAELDPYHARRIDELIDQLCDQGITVILSTHNVDRALAWADRVVILHRGTVLGEGLPEEILEKKELMDMACLEVPMVLQMFRQLQNSGVLAKDLPIPKTAETLKEYVKQLE